MFSPKLILRLRFWIVILLYRVFFHTLHNKLSR